jgi:ADP-ribosyl-[dinitrogen reductase] hydrolase
MRITDHIRSALFGVAVGDAIGVPAEFRTRESMQLKPVTEITGHGTYNLPPGTWSDDSSLTFCLAEALTQEFDLKKIAANFISWRYHNYWTPRGEVFDVGMATDAAIRRLKNGVQPELAGGFDVESNGNGSLMRILPLLFYIKDKPVEERYQITKLVSSITHGHVRSVIACFYYLEFAKYLMEGMEPAVIWDILQGTIPEVLTSLGINPDEIAVFDRLLEGKRIDLLPEWDIKSSGYVVHTLEASIWCLFNASTYKDAILQAVNLGYDTDTTAAVTGGLAGLYYEYWNIPEHWLYLLAKKEEIEDLVNRLSNFILLQE